MGNNMTSCSCIEGLEIYPGRHYTLKFTLTTSTPLPATPLDLTDAKIWFGVKNETTDLDEDAIFLKKSLDAGGGPTEIAITDATGGICEVYILPADTDDLMEGDYWYDMVIENSSGKKMQAVAPSKFHVGFTVTKASTP